MSIREIEVKGILFSAILFFSLLPIVYTESYNWNLRDSIDQAMSENLVLKQKQIDLDQRQTTRDRSWNLLLPDVNADMGLSKGIPQNSDPWSVYGNLGVSMNLKASLPYLIKNLQNLLDKEIISYEQFKQVYIRDIKKFFYQILLVKERISLAKEKLKLIDMQYEKSSLLYEAGLTSDLDLMSVKVNLANTRSDILSLKNDYTSKLFQLKYLTGLNPEDELTLAGQITLPDDILLVSDLSPLISETLELLTLKKEKLILENDRKMAVLQTWDPSLYIGYSYSPELNFPLEDTLIDSGTWLARGAMTISVSIPLNSLLPGSVNQVNLESIDARVKKNELAMDQLIYTTYMELSNIINKLAGIRQTLDARVLAADFSREAHDYTLNSYNTGGVDILDLFSSESNLQEARVSVLIETYNYISSILDLEFLLGIEIIKE
jgi:outer membrane protein TolC